MDDWRYFATKLSAITPAKILVQILLSMCTNSNEFPVQIAGGCESPADLKITLCRCYTAGLGLFFVKARKWLTGVVTEAEKPIREFIMRLWAAATGRKLGLLF
jgi:hypothetical protein